jgi:flavodoxin
MRICILYHSETGNTRHVAQHLAIACNAERLIEILDRTKYGRFTRFASQCGKAFSESLTPISPVTVDVAPYDLIVIGSPVWAYKPTPVIHSAIVALTGYTGKPVIGFFTHGGKPGSTEKIFTRWCEQRWLKVAGTVTIHAKEIGNAGKIEEILNLIQSVGST